MRTILSILMCSMMLYSFSCNKSDDSKDDGETWYLVSWYGTIAGISKNYEKGKFPWTFGDSTITIKNIPEESFILPEKTTYVIRNENGKEVIDIKDIGTFTRIISKDTMFLNAPCCDMIDYRLER
ncbi:MAG: hypothetical protein IPG18_14830 [Saprospiraceae bacterium]|nr:hypothetical protein [Saprospiraceae bacterium]